MKPSVAILMSPATFEIRGAGFLRSDVMCLTQSMQAMARSVEFGSFLCHFQSVTSDFQLVINACGQSFEFPVQNKTVEIKFVEPSVFFASPQTTCSIFGGLFDYYTVYS